MKKYSGPQDTPAWKSQQIMCGTCDILLSCKFNAPVARLHEHGVLSSIECGLWREKHLRPDGQQSLVTHENEEED